MRGEADETTGTERKRRGGVWGGRAGRRAAGFSAETAWRSQTKCGFGLSDYHREPLSAEETLHHGRTNERRPASKPAQGAREVIPLKISKRSRIFVTSISGECPEKWRSSCCSGWWSSTLSARGPVRWGPGTLRSRYAEVLVCQEICQIQNIRFAEAHLPQIIC